MNSVVKDSMIGYVFKEKPRLRKTNDGWGGVLMLPPASLGPPIRWLEFTKHPQI
jgi:hypothetical protein